MFQVVVSIPTQQPVGQYTPLTGQLSGQGQVQTQRQESEIQSNCHQMQEDYVSTKNANSNSSSESVNLAGWISYSPYMNERSRIRMCISNEGEREECHQTNTQQCSVNLQNQHLLEDQPLLSHEQERYRSVYRGVSHYSDRNHLRHFNNIHELQKANARWMQTNTKWIAD